MGKKDEYFLSTCDTDPSMGNFQADMHMFFLSLLTIHAFSCCFIFLFYYLPMFLDIIAIMLLPTIVLSENLSLKNSAVSVKRF